MSNDGTGFEKGVVRRAGDLGVDTDPEPPDIRERVDLDEHDAKTHIATIWYDLDAWEYTVEYSVEEDR